MKRGEFALSISKELTEKAKGKITLAEYERRSKVIEDHLLTGKDPEESTQESFLEVFKTDEQARLDTAMSMYERGLES